MGRTAWMAMGLLFGAALAYVGHRMLDTEPEDTVEIVYEAAVEETPRQPIRTANPSGGASSGFVLTDVYTSDEAAQRAYSQPPPRQPSSEPDDSGVMVFTPSEPFVGLFDEGGEDTETLNLLREEDAAREEEDPALMTPEAREVIAVVEMFLIDAMETRDLQAYLTALDEDFRYTFDNGTPAFFDDDRVVESEDYREMATAQLFREEDDASVRLSRPRAFDLASPDVASITYDYDMVLENNSGNRNLMGTASFLLMRGGATGDSDAWRIVEWIDSPPQATAP